MTTNTTTFSNSCNQDNTYNTSLLVTNLVLLIVGQLCANGLATRALVKAGNTLFQRISDKLDRALSDDDSNPSLNIGGDAYKVVSREPIHVGDRWMVEVKKVSVGVDLTGVHEPVHNDSEA